MNAHVHAFHRPGVFEALPGVDHGCSAPCKEGGVSSLRPPPTHLAEGGWVAEDVSGFTFKELRLLATHETLILPTLVF